MKQTALDYLYGEIWDKPKDKLVWYLIFMEAGAIYRNQIKEAYKAGAKDLEAKGLEVLLDDRREASPGVKFKDAELIGIPKIIIVGKALADGKVEIRDRKSGDKSEVAVGDVAKHFKK